jgi:imidazolonepropionase-like amidohydrolase
MEYSKTNFVKNYEPGKHSRVELKNGRVLDVVRGNYFDAGTSIILHDGKIEAMTGLKGEANGYKSDFTIDLQGKTVMPSLYNTHMHGPESSPSQFPGRRDRQLTKKHEEDQIEKNMAECLAHGVTNIRHAGFVTDLRVNRSRMERYLKDGIPAPRMAQAVVVGPTGSYMQEDLPAWMKLLGMPQVNTSKEYAAAVSFPLNASEQQVRDAVDIAIDERGADLIKVGDESFSYFSNKPVPRMSNEQLRVLVDQARRRGVQTTMHHTSVESFRRGAMAGLSSLAHEPFDTQLSPEDMEAFKQSGCLIEPTLSVFYAMFGWKLEVNKSNNHPELERLTKFRENIYTYADIAKDYYIPELRDGVMNGYKKITSGNPKIMGIIDNSGYYAWDSKAELAFENFVKLFEYGIPMATGNDTVAPCTPAMVGLELRLFDHVLKGKPDGKQLNGAEAVKIATFNGARCLGLDNKFGSIETGKTADLVILDGDPLEDFRLVGSRVDALFMDGMLAINNCSLEVVINGHQDTVSIDSMFDLGIQK